MNSQDIEINILKSKIESLEDSVRFLEKNWLTWTKDTTEIGRRVVTALLEKSKE